MFEILQQDTMQDRGDATIQHHAEATQVVMRATLKCVNGSVFMMTAHTKSAMEDSFLPENMQIMFYIVPITLDTKGYIYPL